MKDVPDSDSDSEANDTFKGLSTAAINLGEGAIMYLQMMKTFAVLFLVLAVINMPIYMIYSSITPDNDYSSLESAFKYFSMGTLAKGELNCGYSSIDYDNSAKMWSQLEIPTVFNEETKESEPMYKTTLDKPLEDLHALALNNTLRKFNLSCEEMPDSYI